MAGTCFSLLMLSRDYAQWGPTWFEYFNHGGAEGPMQNPRVFGQADPGHGHSHGGSAPQHGHSHGGQPCHGHGSQPSAPHGQAVPQPMEAPTAAQPEAEADRMMVEAAPPLDSKDSPGVLRRVHGLVGEWRVLRSRYERCEAEWTRLKRMGEEHGVLIEEMLATSLSSDGG